VNLTILVYQKNTGDGVIRGIRLDHCRKGRVEIVEDVCRNKGRSEELQGPHCGDLARGAPLRKPSQWDDDIGARR